MEIKHQLTLLLLIGIAARSCPCARAQAPAKSAPTKAPVIELDRGVRPFINSSFALAVAPDGSEYSIAGRRGDVVSYDAATHKELRRVEHPEGMVLDLAYGRSLDCLIAVGDPKRLRILSRQGQLLHQVPLPYRCGFIAAHPRLPVVALSGRSPQSSATHNVQQVLFVNIQTGKPIGGFSGSLRRAFQLAFSPDGSRLYAAADIGSKDATRHALLEIATERLTAEGFSPGATKGGAAVRLHEDRIPIRNMALAPDGQHVAILTQTGTVVLIDCQRRAEVYKWRGDADQGNVLEFFTNRLLVASGREQWRVYAVDELEPAGICPAKDSTSANHLLPLTRDVAVSSHARADNQLLLWKLEGFAERASSGFAGPIGPSHPAAIRPTQGAQSVDSMSPERDPNALTRPRPAPATAPAASGGSAMPLSARTWTQASSGRQLKATLVGRDGDALLLVQENGAEAVVSCKTLVGENQQYANREFPNEPSEHLLASPAMGSGVFRGAMTDSDLRWVVQQLQCESPASPLRLSASKPNGRGGAWIATELGLASLHGNQLTLAALMPRDSSPSKIELAPQVSTLVVDRFGRPVVQWGASRQSFRWNGVQWIHLPAPDGLSPMWLARAGKDLFALLSTQREDDATVIARLNGTRWEPWNPGKVSGTPGELRQLYGSSAGHLIGVRKDKPPVRLAPNGPHELEAGGLDDHALRMLKSIYGPMPKVAVTNDGVVHYLRQTATKSSLEWVSLDAAQSNNEKSSPAAAPRVQRIEVDNIQQPVPTGMDVDARGRLWMQIVPSQAERAAQIVDGGKLTPSHGGFFVRDGDRWRRVEIDAGVKYPVRVLQADSRKLQMDWTSAPAYRPWGALREWQTADGKHKTQAALRDLTPTRVELHAERGSVSIARNQMSTLDQQFLERVTRFRQRSSAPMPRLERRRQRRTAGDSFFNEDWRTMLERGEILPKIDHVAAPRQNSDSQEHIWVISQGQVARWKGEELHWAPRLAEDSSAAPESPEQVVVDDKGNVYVCCRDQRVRMLSQGGWVLMDQGMDLAVHRLRVVRGQLVAVVGQHSATNRARGAPKSPFTGVMQWTKGQWRSLVRTRFDATGSALDVVALQGGESDQVVVSWSSNRFLACTLGRVNEAVPARMPALEIEEPLARVFTVADGMLYAVGDSLPFSDLRCLWDSRHQRFTLEHASHDWRQRKARVESLHVDSRSMVWGFSGRPFCSSGAQIKRFEISDESPRHMTLVGDNHVALWGSHLSLYEIIEQ